MKNKLFLLFVSVILILGSCASQNSEKDSSPVKQLTASHEEAETWATNTLNSMTLEQKVAQMLFEVLNASYMAEDDPKFQYFVKLVRDYGIGGFVLSGGTPQDTARILNRLQEEAKIPLFVSNAFEGGPGQMIRGATNFPANMAFSAIGEEKLAEQAGRIGAKEGRAMGIHITWSPVVDILTRPENPVQSVRSFGGDLELLGRLASSYIKGYQENGMLATAKHFPGRGDVDLIPGTEFTINRKPSKQVEDQDFFAFKKAIEAGVTFIMSDHIAVPSVTDGSDLPASVEPKLATYWLRKKLDFEGILISDDMWYEKVINRFGKVESCIMAVKAGHDAILKPGDAIETVSGLADAVRAGEIQEEQVDQSVKKILYWKARLNLHHNRFVDEEKVSSAVGIKEHQDFVHKIAESSLTLLKNDGYFPSDTSKVGKVFHLCIQRKERDPAPSVASSELKAVFPVEANIILRPNSSKGLYEKALKAAAKADTVLVSLFNQRTRYIDNGPLRDKDLDLINRIIKIKPHSTVVMSYGNPYLAESLNNVAAFVVGYGEGGFYGNQIVYVDAFIKLLKGDISPHGKLPVKVSENFPLGSGIIY